MTPEEWRSVTDLVRLAEITAEWACDMHLIKWKAANDKYRAAYRKMEDAVCDKEKSEPLSDKQKARIAKLEAALRSINRMCVGAGILSHRNGDLPAFGHFERIANLARKALEE